MGISCNAVLQVKKWSVKSGSDPDDPDYNGSEP